MDYNYLLLLSMLPSGRYDGLRKQFEQKRLPIFLNNFCAAVNLFCGVKYCFIMALPSRTKSILYLSELYLYETPAMILFQLGSTIIHFTIFYVYLYMAALCRDGSRFECLRFMFIPNLKDLCELYDLDAKATKTFLRNAAYIRYLLYLLIFGFEIFYFVLVSRCLVIAYFEIEFKYFLVFTVPLTVITWFSYQTILNSILTNYIFMFTTQEFLRLRFETVAQQVREYHKNKKSRRYRARLQITQTIDDIVRQFNASNLLFDDLL